MCYTVLKGTIAYGPFPVNESNVFTYLFCAALSDLLLSNYIYKINEFNINFPNFGLLWNNQIILYDKYQVLCIYAGWTMYID